MSAHRPRFEVVRTSAGWHARFIAGNGQPVWVTESYTRKRAAVNAVEVITGRFVYRVQGDHFISRHDGTIEVRTVDERTA